MNKNPRHVHRKLPSNIRRELSHLRSETLDCIPEHDDNCHLNSSFYAGIGTASTPFTNLYFFLTLISKMTTARALSDGLAYLLAGFNAFCIQAHLTSRFSPVFSKNLATQLPHHNKAIFWWLGVSDETLRYIFVSLNAGLGLLLALPGWRSTGLKVALVLLCVGFTSDMKLKEKWLLHFLSHLVLLSITMAAIYVR